MRCGVLLLGLAVLVGCAKKDPRYCDSETPCTLLEFPYCDENGAISGIRNNCIPEPGDSTDASVADASPADASNDAGAVLPGLGEACSVDGLLGTCPAGVDCVIESGEEYGYCAPTCSAEGADEECAAAYDGPGLAACVSHASGPRCVIRCALGAVGDCPSGSVCRPMAVGEVCVPLENGLGQSCTASEDCPPANDCFEYDDGSGISGMCGPSCDDSAVCGYNTDYLDQGFSVDCFGVCALTCDSADACPPGLTCASQLCVKASCGIGEVLCGSTCVDPSIQECTSNADCSGGTVCRDCSCVAP
jgi:hypothetical protein